MFPFMYRLHFSGLFIRQWILGLFTHLGYCDRSLKIVKFIEAKNGMVVARHWMRQTEEVFAGGVK